MSQQMLIKDNLGCQPSQSTLLKQSLSLLFTTAHSTLAGQWASRDSLVSSFHLTLGILGLLACTIMPGFIWIIWIRTQVQYHTWLVLYPPSNFLSPSFLYTDTIEMSNGQLVGSQGSLLSIFKSPTVGLFVLSDGELSWLPSTFLWRWSAPQTKALVTWKATVKYQARSTT